MDTSLIFGDKVCILKGNKAEIDMFAGAKVMVTGKVSRSIVTESSIEAAL
jgi:hydroxyethylthiazole kinase-like sugar kinase family protein